MSKHSKHQHNFNDLEHKNLNTHPAKEQKCDCQSGDKCTCGENCYCENDCTCNNCECESGKCTCENCDCENGTCNCDENCDCQHGKCTCKNCNCKNAQIDSLQKKANEYLELARRSQAEFDNYRKRTKQSETLAKQDGIILAVESILPVVDSIDNAKKQVVDANFVKSLDLVSTQLMQSLTTLGVSKISALNAQFDPNLHNAVLTGCDKAKLDNQILEEYQAGFVLNGKVIRHSVVKVNKLEN